MMKFDIPIEELRKRKIFIATPMYGGMCTGTYCKSMTELATWLGHHGIPYVTHFIFNESLITRARNYCVDEFMRSDCTHLLFIDADIQFRPEDVITMIWLQSDDSPYDVITAPYPKKNISWEKIVVAVNKGVADKNPNELEKYVGDFVFNMPPGTSEFRINEPVEVMEAGTGFMSIRRKTFEAYQEKYPEYLYKPDHVRSENFDGSREIMAFFDCIIDPVSKRYLSEDYFFCQNARKVGLKVWMIPWINLAHFGSYNFTGSMLAMAQLGITPTADEGLLRTQRAPENAGVVLRNPVQSNPVIGNVATQTRKERRAAKSLAKK